MQKSAIAIFNPQNPIEAAFSDAYNELTGQWMTAGEMKDVMRALPTYRALAQVVKRNPVETSKLLFGQENTGSQWYYPCDIVDLRLVLSENQISWHAPILLFSPKAATKLMSQYPLCLVLDRSVVKTGRNLGGVTVMKGNRLQLASALKHIMVRTYLGQNQMQAIYKIIKETYGDVPVYVMHDLPGLAYKAAMHEGKQTMNWYNVSKQAAAPNESYDKPFLIGELPKSEADKEEIEVMQYVPEHERLKRLYPPGDGYVFRYTQIDLNANGGKGAKTKLIPVTRSLISQPTRIEITRIDEKSIYFKVEGSKEEQHIPLEAYMYINRPLN